MGRRLIEAEETGETSKERALGGQGDNIPLRLTNEQSMYKSKSINITDTEPEKKT